MYKKNICVCVRVDYYYITLSSIEWVHLNHFSWWDKIAVTSSSTQADVRRHRPVGWRLQQNLFPSGWREILRETIGNHYILRTKITIYIYYTPYIYIYIYMRVCDGTTFGFLMFPLNQAISAFRNWVLRISNFAMPSMLLLPHWDDHRYASQWNCSCVITPTTVHPNFTVEN